MQLADGSLISRLTAASKSRSRDLLPSPGLQEQLHTCGVQNHDTHIRINKTRSLKGTLTGKKLNLKKTRK